MAEATPKEQLIAAGADLIVPDFREGKELRRYLLDEEQSHG